MNKHNATAICSEHFNKETNCQEGIEDQFKHTLIIASPEPTSIHTTNKEALSPDSELKSVVYLFTMKQAMSMSKLNARTSYCLQFLPRARPPYVQHKCRKCHNAHRHPCNTTRFRHNLCAKNYPCEQCRPC